MGVEEVHPVGMMCYMGEGVLKLKNIYLSQYTGVNLGIHVDKTKEIL